VARNLTCDAESTEGVKKEQVSIKQNGCNIYSLIFGLFKGTDIHVCKYHIDTGLSPKTENNVIIVKLSTKGRTFINNFFHHGHLISRNRTLVMGSKPVQFR
jgi:hypothetical protein